MNINEFKPIKVDDIQEQQPKFYLEDFLPIPEQAITLLSGRGGVGKSFLAIQIALRLSEQGKKVLMWLSEDPVGITKHRINKIKNGIPEAGNNSTNIYTITKTPMHINSTNSKKYEELFKGFDLVILDPFIAFYGENENSNTEARVFMNLLNNMATNNNQSYFIIHHSTKGSKEQESTTRGAGGITDATRLAYEIKTTKNTMEREIKIVKDNWGIKKYFNNKESKTIKILPPVIERTHYGY
jgi:replicative DNA helicase